MAGLEPENVRMMIGRLTVPESLQVCYAFFLSYFQSLLKMVFKKISLQAP